MAKIKAEVKNDDQTELLDRDDIIVDAPDDKLIDVAPPVAAVAQPEDAVAELKKQLEDEKAARIAANDRAVKAERERGEATAKTSDSVEQQIISRKDAIESTILSAQTSLESVKQELRLAKSSGDIDAEVEAQDRFNDARLKLNAATWEKQQFDQWEAKYRDDQKKLAAQPKQDGQPQFSAKEQEWIAKHARFGTDQEYTAIAAAAANLARQRGIAHDSPAYFEAIERAIAKAGFDDVPSYSTQQRDPTSSAAPPSRSETGFSSRDGRVSPGTKWEYVPNGFRIPREWKESAESMNMDPRTYANERLKNKALGLEMKEG